MTKRHTLSKRDLLEYALDGARTRYGLQSGNMDEEEEDLLDRDIREIERRIKLVDIAAARPKPSGGPVPVTNADGTLANFTLRDHNGKPFRCGCGCNVFHKPDARSLNVFKCNSCDQEYLGEPA